MCERVIQKSHQEGQEFKNQTKGILSVHASPMYPSSVIKTPSELRMIVKDIKIKDYYGSFRTLPYYDIFSSQGNGVLVQDGIIFVRTLGWSNNLISKKPFKGN